MWKQGLRLALVIVALVFTMAATCTSGPIVAPSSSNSPSATSSRSATTSTSKQPLPEFVQDPDKTAAEPDF